MRRSFAAALLGAAAAALSTAAPADPVAQPEDVDARAARLVDAMTLDEQISLLRPLAAFSLAAAPGADKIPAMMRGPLPPGAIGSAGFVPPIPRLDWPALQESDAGLGVANFGGGLLRPGDEATALPSSLALAASFDLSLARQAGAVIGAEAHAKGFNVQLAGGVNLARDPRNGRNFEYAGEDPLLAGLTAGSTVAGIQSQHIVSAVKHYAMNDQESGRNILDARIDEAAARESDLLAFRIAIDTGHPGSVMCAYNKINGAWACENDFLLDRVLKHDWNYGGWVMSDWGGVHSLEDSVAHGLDQQSPGQVTDYFAGLKEAVEKGAIPKARVRDMALRIVRSVVAAGALDDPARPGGTIDQEGHAAIAQAAEESGAVLLKNDALLPLQPAAKRIVVVGGRADKWVMMGGGSSLVNPFGGAQYNDPSVDFMGRVNSAYVKSSPLEALRAQLPAGDIQFDDGSDPVRTAAAARGADAVIVFATKSSSEGLDSPDLALPGGQDQLIAAVSAANKNTAVVLETGNPVAMPWLGSVRAVLEAWYPGQHGGQAIAALLSGAASPSGRLPITFPHCVDELPRPALDTSIAHPPRPFAVKYDEGSDVGHRWYERTRRTPLFAFGYGLTYTTFRYSQLHARGGAQLGVDFDITNTGRRPGTEVAQLYVAPPGRTHRLAGWARVELRPGETRRVSIVADPRLLESYGASGWVRARGRYDILVSQAAGASALHAITDLSAQ
jgi:beta-glucosidase